MEVLSIAETNTSNSQILPASLPTPVFLEKPGLAKIKTWADHPPAPLAIEPARNSKHFRGLIHFVSFHIDE
jgi:hypothetical protein